MADDTSIENQLPSPPNSRNGFRIAIICALPLEAEMVEMVLDQDWADSGKKYKKAAGDKNTYTTGAIAEHNVVLAYMPSMGPVDAASVATGLRLSFPKVELAFVVGICGVVPVHPKTKKDIFLGDCIISTSVVQYDLGSQHHNGFQKKEGRDTLGRASPEVRAFVAKLQGRKQHIQLTKKAQQHLRKLLNEDPAVAQPGYEHDHLYQPAYLHQHTVVGCGSCDKSLGVCREDCDTIGCDPAFVVKRNRTSSDPQLYFGAFGCASTVMKSGLHRGSIAGSELLAFEMESAGVWDNFPTIVIKSACDYADSHKNKRWQEYAAASAAASLKAVLEKLELSDEEISQGHPSPTAVPHKLSEIEMECLQSLCLQPSYRDIKDRTLNRVEGTCNWALSQDAYKDWLQREGGKLLISADPGCGKSVLAKHLIDEELPKALSGYTICYYFFKDQIQNKLAPALCAVCHQLMITDYALLRKHAVRKFQQDRNIATNVGTLLDILRDTLSDQSAPSVVVIFDALDECEPTDCKKLIGLLEAIDKKQKLKILLTSRPYYGIVSEFKTVTARLHIPGEQESKAISKEVDLVIKHRLNILCKQKHFSNELQDKLLSMLQLGQHRTYLWIYLVFDELEAAMTMTELELRNFFSTLPQSVNEAYERILSKHSHNPVVRSIVHAAISVILAAYEPLTMAQLQEAIKAFLHPQAESYGDLDIEPAEQFETKLRNWCGLFVHVHDSKVTFIHQTAREFLILKESSGPKGLSNNQCWMGCLTVEQAHEVMARACVVYILVCGRSDIALSDNEDDLLDGIEIEPVPIDYKHYLRSEVSQSPLL